MSKIVDRFENASFSRCLAETGKRVKEYNDAKKALEQVVRDATELRKERDLLRQAVVRYCDHSRMGTVEPMSLQQVIDDAFASQPTHQGTTTA
jgi:uncharacterized protein (UPF0264 family)